MAGRKKKKKKVEYSDIDINVMPFIDVFSLLNTFLLMSAAFISIGVLEVQVPFLSSSPPQDNDKTRTLSVKVEVSKREIIVSSEFSQPPANKNSQTYANSERGIDSLHKHLVGLRASDPNADKVQLFTEDDVLWENISAILDAIKLRRPGDPVFEVKGVTGEELASKQSFLFPKVVMASVIL